jgi:hypothetical protein
MTNSISQLGRAMECIALAACTVGCATVTRGTSESWKVVTSPTDASVETSNGFTCSPTPCTCKMKRKVDFEVTVTRDGYKSYHGHVGHRDSNGGAAAMAGNVLIGGLIGAGVDASDGAMMELTPNPMIVDLEKLDQPIPRPAVAEPPMPPSTPPASAPSQSAPAPAAPAVASPATKP